MSITFITLDDTKVSGTILSAINKKGHIVGTGYLSGGGSEGISYKPAYPSGHFKAFSDPSQDTNTTVANGIDNLGDIVGSYTAGGPSLGFLDVGGSFSTISVPGSTSTTANGVAAVGLSDTVDVVGTFTVITGAYHAYLYDSGNDSYTTIDAPNGTNRTMASGINHKGQIIGRYVDTSGVGHGFIDTNGSIVTLDDPGAGDFDTRPLGINDHGAVVGSYLDGGAHIHGFLYVAGVFTTLDDPNGVNGTIASGINDNGDVVGSYTDSSSTVHGFLIQSIAVLAAVGSVGASSVGSQPDHAAPATLFATTS
jgi:hypothetical protein